MYEYTWKRNIINLVPVDVVPQRRAELDPDATKCNLINLVACNQVHWVPLRKIFGISPHMSHHFRYPTFLDSVPKRPRPCCDFSTYFNLIDLVEINQFKPARTAAANTMLESRFLAPLATVFLLLLESQHARSDQFPWATRRPALY